MRRRRKDEREWTPQLEAIQAIVVMPAPVADSKWEATRGKAIAELLRKSCEGSQCARGIGTSWRAETGRGGSRALGNIKILSAGTSGGSNGSVVATELRYQNHRQQRRCRQTPRALKRLNQFTREGLLRTAGQD